MLSNAQMLAVIAAGGSVALPNGAIITTAAQVPSQAAIDAGTVDAYSDQGAQAASLALRLPEPDVARVAKFVPNFIGGFSADGDAPTITGTPTNTIATATDPSSLSLASAATLNANAGVYGNLLMHFAKVPILHKSSVKLAQTAVVRAWVGLSNVGFATMAGADDPAAQDFAAFRYSTAAGDVTWKCCTKDAATIGITDSGVPIDTNFHRFEISFNGTSAAFKIDGVTVATRTANLPRAAALMCHGAQLQTLEAVAKNIAVGWVYTRCKAP